MLKKEKKFKEKEKSACRLAEFHCLAKVMRNFVKEGCLRRVSEISDARFL